MALASSTSVDVLTTIARTLVIAQKYTSTEEALRSIALSEVRRKMAYYRQRIRALERKYGVDFDSFSARIQGRATPAEEDDWLAWRSADRMLADWRKVYERLKADRIHA